MSNLILLHVKCPDNFIQLKGGKQAVLRNCKVKLHLFQPFGQTPKVLAALRM